MKRQLLALIAMVLAAAMVFGGCVKKNAPETTEPETTVLETTIETTEPETTEPETTEAETTAATEVSPEDEVGFIEEVVVDEDCVDLDA